MFYYNWIKQKRGISNQVCTFEDLAKAVRSEHGAAKTARPLQETTGMKDFIRLELELVLTFVNLARTRYSMGHIASSDISRNNAEKAYRSALKYLGKCDDISPLEREKFMALVNQAKDAIATLPKAETKLQNSN